MDIDDEKSAPEISISSWTQETYLLPRFATGSLAGQNATLVTPQTRFMAYSTTKIITAIAILQLIERGQMEAGCASDDILAESAPWRTAITARRMLLNHTSGIPTIPSDWFVTEEDQANSIATWLRRCYAIIPI
jgi:CubicO group peptidase (beta-lactamase class C family)